MDSQALVIGDVNWDSVEIPSRGYAVQKAGGAAFHVAKSLKQCGIYPKIAATLGRDHNGNRIREEFQRCDLDTDFLQFSEQYQTGFHHTVRRNHENRFTQGNSGANKLGPDSRLLQEIDYSHSRFLWICGYSLLTNRRRGITLELMRRFRQRSLPVILDILPHHLDTSHLNGDYLEATQLATIVVAEIAAIRSVLSCPEGSPDRIVRHLQTTGTSCFIGVTNDRWLIGYDGGIRRAASGYSELSILDVDGSLDAWVSSIVAMSSFSERGTISKLPLELHRRCCVGA